eukprot:11545027-Prorocentrum_lima.AAC.1
MEDTSSGLLWELHGKSLRLLCEKAGVHAQGLQAASRHFRHALPQALLRKLRHLDFALALSKHITRQGNEAFIAQLEKHLSTGMPTSSTNINHDHSSCVDVENSFMPNDDTSQ